MRKSQSSQSGFSLIEVVVALGVLTVGALGTAAVFVQGMQRTTSSPGDLIATQKATEAIESVFSARDSHVLVWAQIRNVRGASGHDGGIFLDSVQPMKVAGNDGLVNTSDDGSVEVIQYPGRDQILNTNDDYRMTLSGFTREIKIEDIANEPELRSITVTITYQAGQATRTYKLTAYISTFA